MSSASQHTQGTFGEIKGEMVGYILDWIINRFLCISKATIPNIKSFICPSIKSDHSLIEINFTINGEWTQGRGFYKFNTGLLKNKAYVDMMNKEIFELENEANAMAHKAIFRLL